MGGAKPKVSWGGEPRVPGARCDGTSQAEARVRLDGRVCENVVRAGVAAKLGGLVGIGLGEGRGQRGKGRGNETCLECRVWA